MTSGAPDLDRVRQVLEQNRVWSAYALADLEPPQSEESHWFLGERSVLLLYSGLTPPLVFYQGDSAELERLAMAVPPGSFQYALQGTDRSRLRSRIQVGREVKMWRMVHRGPLPTVGAARRLGEADAPAIATLFAGHPDGPDSFDPRQLSDGVFYGVERAGTIVAVSGTHVVGRRARVAAVGNVFTHPDHRRRGFGLATCASVVRDLIQKGIETVVLNVGMDNLDALGLYSALGFLPFCGYYEGVGEITAAAAARGESHV